MILSQNLLPVYTTFCFGQLSQEIKHIEWVPTWPCWPPLHRIQVVQTMDSHEGCEQENLHLKRTTKLAGRKQDFWCLAVFCQGSIALIYPIPYIHRCSIWWTTYHITFTKKWYTKRVILLRCYIKCLSGFSMSRSTTFMNTLYNLSILGKI